MSTVEEPRMPGLGAYSPDERKSAEAAFAATYPSFATTRILDDLRATEYARLDEGGHIYLDYTGGGLYAASQLQQHLALLAREVLGNPHSRNPSALAMTALVERARAQVRDFFSAGEDEYEVIFTPNASGALKLVGEAYPFGRGSRYVLTADNHNSVNGIREFARRHGADATYVPVVAPEMRLDDDALARALDTAPPGSANLLAFPAQSNFTGVRHSLEWIDRAHAQGWDVLLDAAAFVPANRLDLSAVKPDFVTISFYKIFGYPTGVGALLARKPALGKLRRPWFAGGTISIASVKGDAFFVEGSAAWEDGTVNYLSLPAVEIGLRYTTSIGIATIHERVACLSGWLLEHLCALRHTNGQPMARILGPRTSDRRGGTIAFNFLDPQGEMLNYQRIEELAAECRISLRTGCFCNPGAGEIAYGLTEREMRAVFAAGTPLSFTELYDLMRGQGKGISAIRVSVGLASTFGDVFCFMRFAAGLRDKSIHDLSVDNTTMAPILPAPDTA